MRRLVAGARGAPTVQSISVAWSNVNTDSLLRPAWKARSMIQVGAIGGGGCIAIDLRLFCGGFPGPRRLRWSRSLLPGGAFWRFSFGIVCIVLGAWFLFTLGLVRRLVFYIFVVVAAALALCRGRRIRTEFLGGLRDASRSTRGSRRSWRARRSVV